MRSRARQVSPDLDSLYASWMQQMMIPGMAYGIVLDGELVHAGYVGVQDHNDAATSVTRETRFRIASMTKSFTAMAIQQLRDKSVLRLDDLWSCTCRSS